MKKYFCDSLDLMVEYDPTPGADQRLAQAFEMLLGEECNIFENEEELTEAVPCVSPIDNS
jgi:hypothetical protein